MVVVVDDVYGGRSEWCVVVVVVVIVVIMVVIMVVVVEGRVLVGKGWYWRRVRVRESVNKCDKYMEDERGQDLD
jgi:hypothetical protein